MPTNWYFQTTDFPIPCFHSSVWNQAKPNEAPLLPADRSLAVFWDSRTLEANWEHLPPNHQPALFLCPGERFSLAQCQDVVSKAPMNCWVFVDPEHQILQKLFRQFWNELGLVLPKMIAITGTNGKTSVAQICAQMLYSSCTGQPTRVLALGTLGPKTWGWEGLSSWARHDATSPTMHSLPVLLCFLTEAGLNKVKFLVLEASSHGLVQNRLGDLKADVAVFTNLSPDHLDYHGTMESYGEAKSRLFTEHLRPDGIAVLNGSDPFCDSLKPLTQQVRRIFFFPKSSSFLDANACAVEAILYGLQQQGELLQVLESSWENSKLKVLGRMQKVLEQPQVYVDFAHTPDALEKVLLLCRELLPAQAKLLCVFGCGGERDAHKRPLMGKIAENQADICIITSDNPRSEDPQTIAEEILQGMTTSPKTQVILDRRTAIWAALRLAAPEDVVLIAGKGHESTQQMRNKILPFSDCLVVEEFITRKI